MSDPSSSLPRVPGPPRPAWPWTILTLAALLGLAGVIVGAAGAHLGGSDLARTASEFMLIHAAVLVGGAGLATAHRSLPRLWGVAMGLLAVGAFLFGGELALAGLADWRPVPLAAPAGGLCLIAGWLALATAALGRWLNRW